MKFVYLKYAQFTFPHFQTILDYLNEIDRNFIIDAMKIIIKESLTTNKDRVSIRVDGIKNIDIIRKKLTIKILNHYISKVKHKRIIRYIFDRIPDPILDEHWGCYNPLKYADKINAYFLYNDSNMIDTKETLSNIVYAFIPRFAQLEKKDINIYYVSEDDKIYVFNHDKKCTFINYLKKCNTIDDAITECNYFENRNRIVEIYREDNMYNESHQ